MIEINFGKSEWILHRPDSPSNYPDNIVRIPQEGELPQFGTVVKDERPQALSTSWTAYSPPYNYGPKGYEFTDYNEIMKLEPHQDDTQGYSSVVISRPRPKITDNDIELLMLWIEERKEWIVIWHRTWMESAFLDDECFDGPFSLDEMCASKILQAYGIPEGRFKLDEVRRIDPERLRQNSQSSQ